MNKKPPPDFSPKKATLSKPEEVALNIIRKQLGGVNDLVQAEMAKVRKETADTTKTSHRLIMHSLDQITKLTHSRLLDATYLRKASLREPTLDERGCQTLSSPGYEDIQASISNTFELLAENIGGGRGQEGDMTDFELALVNCGQMSGCSLETELTESFSTTDWAKVSCCPRHQRILESDFRVQIVSTTIIQIPVTETRNGQTCRRAGPVLYVNLVRNGVLF